MGVLSAKNRGFFGTITGKGMIIPPMPRRVISKTEKLSPGSLKKLTNSDIIA
jgi:hypothetical protein